MKLFEGDTAYVGDDFNDITSSLEMMKKGDVTTGKIRFYEGNDATQKMLCTVSTTSDKTCKLKEDDDCGCDNDEARSAELSWVKPGTTITVYDDPDGGTGDDWTEIKVKRLFKYETIGTFEGSYENDYVKVTFHHHNGLDGKVSRIVIEAP
jgi:hypothetical protein